jgi:hypothetical protein
LDSIKRRSSEPERAELIPDGQTYFFGSLSFSKVPIKRVKKVPWTNGYSGDDSGRNGIMNPSPWVIALLEAESD